jgi:ABC-type branched-subunit amino acid transport system substrate-binding protein
MQRIIYKIALAALIISNMTFKVFAGETMPLPKQGLNSALDLYNKGQYEAAASRFIYLANIYPQDENQTIFRFMTAKSLYKAGSYDQADREFYRFISDFPKSTYLAEAFLFRGHIAYAGKRFKESAENYLKANSMEPNSRTGEIALANLEPLLSIELTVPELASLADSFSFYDITGEVKYYLGQKQLEAEDFKSAAVSFRSYLDNHSTGEYAIEAKQSYDLALSGTSRKVTVGVLAPLSGSNADYGMNLVSGVRLIFDGLTSIGGRNVELIIKDTGGDPVKAALAVRELKTADPAVIIGPLRSESAVAAAVAANCLGIPLITPTASEKGITLIGNSIYQLSPPSEKLAATLAEYAVNVMGIKEFGIISPGDFTSRQVTSAFSTKVYELGGEVVATTFYESGQTDFSNQIKPLHDVLVMKTEESIATGSLDSLIYYDTLSQKWLDTKAWRVNLGALFLPGYSDELAMLVPQIRYNVIDTRFLGLFGWDSPKLVERIGNYIQGAVFATDFHQGSTGLAWQDFNRKYRQKYNREPERVAALAYDAATLVRNALQNNAFTADSMTEYLNNVQNFQGASCVINFESTERANNATSIFQINGNSFNELK